MPNKKTGPKGAPKKKGVYKPSYAAWGAGVRGVLSDKKAPRKSAPAKPRKGMKKPIRRAIGPKSSATRGRPTSGAKMPYKKRK